MNTGFLKFAATTSYLAQIVPEYHPSEIITSDEQGTTNMILGAAIIGIVVIVILILRSRRHRRAKKFQDR